MAETSGCAAMDAAMRVKRCEYPPTAVVADGQGARMEGRKGSNRLGRRATTRMGLRGTWVVCWTWCCWG